MNADTRTIREELELLIVDGVLRPEDVVDFARDSSTALHSQFEWNEGEAARQYRLEQARRVIRVHVNVELADVAPIRAYVSLSTDRKNGGGYRTTTSVMSDSQLYEQMLRDALGELVSMQRKYARLKELGKVFRAVDEAAVKQQKLFEKVA